MVSSDWPGKLALGMLSPHSIDRQVVPEEFGTLHCELAGVVQLAILIPPATHSITLEHSHAFL